MRKYILLLSLLLGLFFGQICHAQSTTGPAVNSVTALKNGGTNQSSTWVPSGSGKIIIFGDSLALGLTGPSSCASGTNANSITAVGSLTGACWADKIGVFFNMPVLNVSFGGAPLEHCVTSSTGGCAQAGIDTYATKVIANANPADYVIMLWGTNDSLLIAGQGAATVDPGEPTFSDAAFTANYTTIVNAILAAGLKKSHIAISTAPWRSSSETLVAPIVGPVAKFNKASVEAAINTGVPVIDFYSAVDNAGWLSSTYYKNTDLYSNGGHPNDNGNLFEARAAENPILLKPLQLWSVFQTIEVMANQIPIELGLRHPTQDSNRISIALAGTQQSGSTFNDALANITTNQFAAYSDIAIGNSSQGANPGTMTTAASNNVSVGILSLGEITSANLNAAFGNEAGYHITTATHTTAIGQQALQGNSGANRLTGSDNTAVGYAALTNDFTTAAQNTCAGSQCLGSLSVSNTNTALGYKSGFNIGFGASQNLVLGANVATTTIVGGSNNILIGVNSAIDATTSQASNEIHIGGTGGDWAAVTGSNTAATAAATLHGTLALVNIASDATHTDATVCEDTTSHTLFAGSGTLGVCLGTSSARYKNNIIDIPSSLERLMQLRPVNFNLDANHGDPKKKQFGFIAEEAIKVFPDLVTTDTEGRPNTFDYLGLISPIVKGIQEQQQEIVTLSPGIKPYHRCVDWLPVLCGD